MDDEIAMKEVSKDPLSREDQGMQLYHCIPYHVCHHSN